MTITLHERVPITDKEAEGLMWGFAQIGDHADRDPPFEPGDPLPILLAAGYTPEAIKESCEALFELAYDNCLISVLTDLERMILRLSVENSSWIWHYKEHHPAATGMIREARAALRSLSAKLELVGIDINILPTD